MNWFSLAVMVLVLGACSVASANDNQAGVLNGESGSQIAFNGTGQPYTNGWTMQNTGYANGSYSGNMIFAYNDVAGTTNTYGVSITGTEPNGDVVPGDDAPCLNLDDNESTEFVDTGVPDASTWTSCDVSISLQDSKGKVVNQYMATFTPSGSGTWAQTVGPLLP